MRTPFVAAALVFTLSPASADTLRLGASSAPFTTPRLSAKTEDIRVHDAGWKTCDPGGGAFTTRQPILAWEFTEKTEMRIRLVNESGDNAGGGGVIVMPDGTYVCDDTKNQFWLTDWQKGSYKLFLTSGTIGVSAIVSFENPTRTKAQVAAVQAKLPTLELGALTVNPRFESVPATVSIDAGDAGPTCVKGRKRAMPLAKLDVKRASSWYVASGKQELFMITADGQCADPTEARELAAGTHVLWTVMTKTSPPSYAFEIDDRSSDVKFAEATKKAVGSLEAPLVIDGKVRPTEHWYTRDDKYDSCRGGAARAPDFYLTSDKPLQKVTLSLLWSRQSQHVHAFGPIGGQASMRCGDRGERSAHNFDVFEGTYAVWVGGDKAAVDSEFHVLLRNDATKIDAMATLVPIPAELAMADRAIANHYPYFRGANLDEWTKIFTTAPDQLFIYTRTDVDKDGTKIPAGEPLLVTWSQQERTAAIRDDGGHVAIDTRLLTTTRPDKVVLPTVPRIPKVETLETAIRASGGDDAKPIAAYRKLDEKFSICYGNYMQKNDPTWNHSHQVYRISGGRVVNVGDQVSNAASRRCGESTVVAAGKRLEKQLASTRGARFKAHLAAVRKRFGL